MATYGREIAQMGGMPSSSFGPTAAGARAALRQRLERYLSQQAALRQQDQMQGFAQLVMLMSALRGRGPTGQKPVQQAGPALPPEPAQTLGSLGAGAPIDPAATTSTPAYQPWWKLMHDDRYNGGY